MNLVYIVCQSVKNDIPGIGIVVTESNFSRISWRSVCFFVTIYY
jgi:hypothetical protein